jgi:hypothetical protein
VRITHTLPGKGGGEIMTHNKPWRMEFTCQRCGKTLWLDPVPYEKAFAGQDLCLTCRSKARKKARKGVAK